MEKSSFFNSINHDRRYKAENWAEYFSSFIGNGVFPLPSDGLQVAANGSMGVTLKPGKAWANGYFYQNTTPLDLSLGTADGTLKKIARIVVRVDFMARSITSAILFSGASSNPAPPAPTRNADVYEMVLGDVLINKGVTTINQADITDQRFNTNLCGIVTGVVQQIDFSVMSAQFDAFFYLYRDLILERYAGYSNNLSSMETNAANAYSAFIDDMNEFKQEANTDFVEWFEGLQVILDGDAAANLAAQVLQNTSRLDTLEETVAGLVTQSPQYTADAVLGSSYIGIAYLKETA
jgi:hypothetical protein